MSAIQRVGGALRRRADRLRHGRKGSAELEFWKERSRDEGRLANAHYEEFFTTRFGLERSFFAGARVLDVGCGPRGSLEWANEAAERVGVDPLVEDYRALGIDDHAMTYVCAPAEDMPFPDGHFDVVATFNALDHVDDARAAIRELARVTRPGGTALVTVEVGHEPTVTEPQAFGWELVDEFAGAWRIDLERRFALGDDHNVYRAWAHEEPWQSGAGLLVMRLTRLDPAAPRT